MVPGPSWVIAARVDGREAHLLVDTGSFSLRLRPGFLRDATGTVALDLGQGSRRSIQTRAVTAKVNAEAPGLAARFQTRYDGILGLGVLRTMAIGVDSRGQKMHFWFGGRISAATLDHFLGSATLETLLKGGEPGRWYAVQANLNGTAMDLVLDTGALYCTLGPTAAAELRLDPFGKVPAETLAGFTQMPVAMAKSLEVGGLVTSHPLLTVEPRDVPGAHGSLGTDVLANCATVIDLPARRLRITARPARRSTTLEGRLREWGGRVLLLADRPALAVDPGSLLARAGLRSGDTLSRINGTPVLEALRWRECPERLTLQTSRGGATQSVSLP